jgi:signal transduction histidine kinase
MMVVVDDRRVSSQLKKNTPNVMIDPTPIHEARNEPRFSLRKPISYCYGGRRFLTLTLDLGLGGTKVETSHCLPEHEELDIQLDLETDCIWPKGRTVYSKPLHERVYISGVQFINISEQERTLLKNYLDMMKYRSRLSMPFFEMERGTGASPFFVTELGQIREEVTKTSEDVERRSAERMALIERANRELEIFSSGVCHDLRTPLLVIEGFSRRLLKKYSDYLDVRGQQLINLILKEITEMGKLTEDLLTFCRSGPQQVKSSEIDMNELVKGVLRELTGTHPRQIVITIGDLPSALGDREMIRRIFFNLISNALKFTKGREVPVIEMGGRGEETENVYYVKDNGVGFDTRFADRLFYPFQRLHSREEFEGTGIGLAIVQRMVRKHGGRVWAEGRVNEGATLYFTLPKGKPGRNVGTPRSPASEL